MKKIGCPWCGARINNELDKLAAHIFKRHSDDLELCRWARAELEKIGKSPEDVAPKYMGRPLDRVPPKRQDTLPKRLRRLLPK